jgi:MFS family permease
LFFATLANMYSLGNWLPILLERNGLAPAQAVTVTALYNFGGAVGGIAVGALMGRFGIRVLGFGYVAAAVMLLGLQPLAETLVSAMLLSFAIGMFIAGGQACNNALTAAYYPGDVRSTGVGWAQSVGRSSSIMAPLFIAAALANGVAAFVLFAAAAVAALASGGAIYLLLRQMHLQEPSA